MNKKTYFIKADESDAGEESRLEKQREALKPVFDKERVLYFVSGEKFRRAKNIFELITGKVVPNKAEDEQRKQHYERQLAKHGVPMFNEIKDEKGEITGQEPNPEVVYAIYEILGGLIRDEAEQANAEKVKKKMQEEAKKAKIELR